jgi:1,4-alpha-glucan branching enzyme
MPRTAIYLMTLISSILSLGAANFARADDAAPPVAHEFHYKPDAGTTPGAVNLAGDFNGWSTTATPMQKSADGTYAVTIKLAPGKHSYKFVLDGTTWVSDPAADKSLEEDDGRQGKNSAVIISSDDKPAASDAEHTFSYHPSDDLNAKTVNVAGDFNNWSTDAQPMTRGDDGTFTTKVKLSPGTHEYKFVIDGTKWMNDPSADKSLDKPDGNGGANSVVVIK